MIAMSDKHAAALLRKHADIAGMLIANYLEMISGRIDHWLFFFDTEQIAFKGIVAGKTEYTGSAYYHKLPFQMVCADCAHRAERGVVPIEMEDGASTVICISRTADVCRTAALVQIIYSLELPPSMPQSDDSPLRVDDDVIVEILKRFYFDHAPVVAEAVRALEKLAVDHSELLLDLLRNSEELQTLSEQVHAQLADG